MSDSTSWLKIGDVFLNLDNVVLVYWEKTTHVIGSETPDDADPNEDCLVIYTKSPYTSTGKDNFAWLVVRGEDAQKVFELFEAISLNLGINPQKVAIV